LSEQFRIDEPTIKGYAVTHAPAEQPGSLLRRLAALSYDALLVTSVLMLATLAVLALRRGAPIEPGNTLYQLFLVATTTGFFVTFWVRGGQTLGMRAWRLRLVQSSGDPLTWKIGLLRFAASLLSILSFGLGLVWMEIDPAGLSWHDRIAGTKVVMLPKRP
jgi:uncharacterized RDD family membrane protein YckC